MQMQCLRIRLKLPLSNKWIKIRGITGVLLLFSGFSWAEECRPVLSYFFEGKKTEICVSQKHHAWLSMDCQENSKCQALTFLKNIPQIKLGPPSQSETINPGVLLCRSLGGQVIQGRNDRGSQNSFCRAQDESFIDVASLQSHFAAAKGSRAKSAGGNVGSGRFLAPDKSVPRSR